MTTLPEQLVKGVYDNLCRINGEWQPIGPNDIKEVLTAALPFLSVQVAVKKLAWIRPPLSDTLSRCDTDFGTYRTWTHDEANGKWFWSVEGGWNEANGEAPNEEAAKAAAQADYEDRILSALEPSAAQERCRDCDGYNCDDGCAYPEPSAARELALEEIIALCKDYAEDSQPDSEYRLACNDIIEAIQERRALSSPDHADAGKVEGDVEKWSIREIVAKAIAYHSVGDPHAKTIRGDQRWEWFVEEADKFISVFGYYLPAIPSAPASEGAE
ncbi:hypothetical protein [Brucella anthropi]|uniref:hypothetical protein n=1 Tax=Brucella anthropi TaxID=529 RepID=UPI00320B3DAB